MTTAPQVYLKRVNHFFAHLCDNAQKSIFCLMKKRRLNFAVVTWERTRFEESILKMDIHTLSTRINRQKAEEQFSEKKSSSNVDLSFTVFRR